MATLTELTKDLNEQELSRFKDFESILIDMQLKDNIQQDALLYFLQSSHKISLEEIERDFKSSLKTILTLQKLDEIDYSQQVEESENIRKMFFAITKDIRIIMLKIAIVTTRLRHLEDFSKAEQEQLANSIFALFAPLAARLGMSNYKTELENGAFKILNPEKYDEIQQNVDARFHKRQPIVEELKSLVENAMKELGISGRVYGRKKHIYSIYKKLLVHNSLDNLYDLVAVRAIVSSVADCYALIGRLHSEVEPMPNRFKDYIATPKPNGYQSLHTTVKFKGFPVEIQVRTEEMHKYAEYGVAAHWLYKEKRSKQDSLDVQLAWLRQMMEADDISIDDLADSLSQDIYNNEIFVQTPKGKVVYLPNGSTPIDFAYAIHSEVGNKCVGAKVNGKMVPNTHSLNNGDKVEIITNPNSKGPSRDWLKICKTNEAKKKINDFFKKNMKEENINLGKIMLESAIKEKGYSVNKLLTNKNLENILSYYHLNIIDEFYANIGTSAISAKLIANKLAQNYQKELTTLPDLPTQSNNITISAPTEKQIEVKGLNNILIKFAGCCHPMYGDSIIGFVSTGRGVIIHRSICPNVSCFDDSRLLEASWKPIIEKPKKKNNKNPQ